MDRAFYLLIALSLTISAGFSADFTKIKVGSSEIVFGYSDSLTALQLNSSITSNLTALTDGTFMSKVIKLTDWSCSVNKTGYGVTLKNKTSTFTSWAKTFAKLTEPTYYFITLNRISSGASTLGVALSALGYDSSIPNCETGTVVATEETAAQLASTILSKDYVFAYLTFNGVFDDKKSNIEKTQSIGQKDGWGNIESTPSTAIKGQSAHFDMYGWLNDGPTLFYGLKDSDTSTSENATIKTISVWAYPDSLDEETSVISKVVFSLPPAAMMPATSTTYLEVSEGTDGSDSSSTARITCNFNGTTKIHKTTTLDKVNKQWNHIVCTVDTAGMTLTMFLNGELVESKAIAANGFDFKGCTPVITTAGISSTTVYPCGNTIKISLFNVENGGNGNDLHGYIDEFVLLNKTATLMEARALYNATGGTDKWS